MEENYYVQLNPKRFEQHLSPFGNKVLSVLIKQWDKARNHNNNEYQPRSFPAENKRVLTFINESTVGSSYTPPVPPPPPLILSTTYEQTFLEEKSFNFNLTNDSVPKSIELVNTVPKYNYKNDYLHPTVAANKSLLDKSYNKKTAGDSELPFMEETHTHSTNKNKEINWDDMLDSELLVTMTANKDENNETNVDGIFDDTRRFPNEDASKNNNIAEGNNKTNSFSRVMPESEKRKTKTRADTKLNKVKSDENIEPNQPKIKESVKAPIKKNNFRKQKYTKAVKNWLNNVEQHHPVDVDLDNIVSTSVTESYPTREKDKSGVEKTEQIEAYNIKPPTNPITHANLVIEKALKTTKKVVQAQLANKDGVMKFAKPKQHGEDIEKRVDVLEAKPKECKEKKVKKIVAPIESQIPAKDVSYEIRTIDEVNIESDHSKISEINNKEIIAVLIYSNGFCQLNSHHTDGTCAPDSLIINHDDMFYCFKGTGQRIKETLKYLLENNKVVCYGARSVLIYLATHLQMEINAIDIYDAKIGASLLDPDNSPENFTDLQKLLQFCAPFTITTECVLQKSAWYMNLLKECWGKLSGMLVEDSLWKVFVEIEMKLLPIIADMERRGVCVDLAKLNAMEEVLLTRMKLVEQQCYKAAGKTFQINSAAQVGAILYDELQLDTKCNIKIRETISKGAKSTSETMLRSLVSVHRLPKLILEYRHLHKAHATFVTGIAQHVKDGVVRPTWVQTAAATGRIASNNPNLQAIPKTPFILVMFPEACDDADTDGSAAQLMFRSVYVARAGHALLAADFKHVECRVFAHLAGDAGLLRALAAQDDLFKVLAAQWLKKPEGDISGEERERTKRLVYASLYGAGTRKLMEILDVDYAQALQVAASFNRTFPSLKAFGRGVAAACAARGGRVATPRGRRRRLQHIASDDAALKAHAERQAVNFLVQGSAADLCKTAMILTERQLRGCEPAVEARLLLQIHDELVWEVALRHVDRAAAIIKQVMEECGQHCGMALRLPVAVSAGRTWAHMRPLTVVPNTF